MFKYETSNGGLDPSPRRVSGAAIRRVLLWACPVLLVVPPLMSAGRLLPAEQISSRCLNDSRTIRVYLPASYEHSPKRRYPVLYLQDGQNVFSSAGTDCCFGWGSWELDKTADRLAAEGKMQEIIMVAVDNSRLRYQEYRGPSRSSPAKRGGGSKRAPDGRAEEDRFEQYASFLIKELKPQIDHQYRTLRAASHTSVMGSSLGGICSLALAWGYPRTFGAAASLSGSFQIEKNYFLEKVLQPYKRKAKPIRLYLDSGVIDFTGDDDGRRYTQAVASELRRIGWKDEVNLNEFVDLKPLSQSELERTGLRSSKWKEAESSQHNEFYWRQRAWRALVFLFPAS
jgi:predicted alpha/beta superfamily hydrolase